MTCVRAVLKFGCRPSIRLRDVSLYSKPFVPRAFCLLNDPRGTRYRLLRRRRNRAICNDRSATPCPQFNELHLSMCDHKLRAYLLFAVDRLAPRTLSPSPLPEEVLPKKGEITGETLWEACAWIAVPFRQRRTGPAARKLLAVMRLRTLLRRAC